MTNASAARRTGLSGTARLIRTQNTTIGSTAGEAVLTDASVSTPLIFRFAEHLCVNCPDRRVRPRCRPARLGRPDHDRPVQIARPV